MNRPDDRVAGTATKSPADEERASAVPADPEAASARAAAIQAGDLLVEDRPNVLRNVLMQIIRGLRPLLALAVIWEIVARVTDASPILLPRVLSVIEAAWEGLETGFLIKHIGWTTFRLFAGFTIGASVGIVLGLLSGRIRWLADWTVPLVALFLPIPVLAFVPLFILWFGLGNVPVILLVAFGASMPVFMNCYTGTLSVDPVQIDAGQSMGARGRTLFWRIVFPGSLPYIVSGVRVGFARGWRAVIAGEMVSATGFGLGWMIFSAQSLLQTANVMVGIIFIGVVGMVCEKLLWEALEQKTVVKWGMLSSGPARR